MMKISVIFFIVFVFLNSAWCQKEFCGINDDSCIPNDENNKKVVLKENNLPIVELRDEKMNMTFQWTLVPSSNESSSLSTAVKYEISKMLQENDDNFENIQNVFTGGSTNQDIYSKLSSRFNWFNDAFDVSENPWVSASCRDHSKLFLSSLKKFDLWALRMQDSSARTSSGILNGNINQFGDYDQCVNIHVPEENFRGKYCLAYMQFDLQTKIPYLQKLDSLMHAHNILRSDFNDPGHRVPRFSLINWGMCIPSTCTSQDLEHYLKDRLSNLTNGTVINFQVRVEPNMCQSKEITPKDPNIRLAGIFFLCIIGISILSTVYDIYTAHEEQNEWLVTFSLRKNYNWLCDTSSNPNDISSVHGIRFFNALMLLLSHKSMAVFFNPYINRTQMSEIIGRPWTVLGRAASLYTDPFLLFSGMLTAYSLVGRLKRGQSLRLQNEYIGRLFRIVPTLGALILFCTYILPEMGSGPQWNLVVRHHSTLCKSYWWRNLLFIHNYFGFNNMCLTHTHHLGIDTQMFFFAPPLIIALWKWPRKGLFILLGIAAMATVGRFNATIVHKLSNYIYFGTSIKRLFKTADNMYSYPPHRSTVYIMGIFLGYALQVFRNIRLTRQQLTWGWWVSSLLVLVAFIGPAPMGDINYKYNALHAACYAAFAPIAWCSFFVWIVFTSHLGHTNWLSNLFSWKGFQVTTKLSYAIYLTQFPVFFYNVGRRRYVEYYNFFGQMVDTNEILSIIAASIVLTLLFDAPFQNIKKLIFKTAPKQTTTAIPSTSKKMLFYDVQTKSLED